MYLPARKDNSIVSYCG